MKKIGITGAIGSGKTTVCRIFEVLGVPVYYADEAAKRLMRDSGALKENIKINFGKKIYTPDGHLDRKTLADIVFNNKEKLSLLNRLVHPAVLEDTKQWMEQFSSEPFVIKEAALLFESGAYKNLDCVIIVTAPATERIDRVMKRDKVSKQEVKSRMANQWPEAKKKSMADYLIRNGRNNRLIHQVWTIHHQIIKASTRI